MNLLGRENEVSNLCRGLSSAGNMRCALVSGDSGMGKSAVLDATGVSFLAKEPTGLWLTPGKTQNLSPAGWSSQVARRLQCGSSIPRKAVNSFAQAMGKAFATLPHSISPGSAAGSQTFAEVAKVLVEAMEELMIATGDNSFAPVFALDDLDQYHPLLLDWLAQDLNLALRDSKPFKNSRFLFTAREKNQRVSDFIEKFGIERLHEFPLRPLPGSLCLKLFGEFSKERISAEEILKRSDGNPAKILNLASKRINLESAERKKMSGSNQNLRHDFGKLSHQQWSHLFCAAYPNRINRYTLEFFCSPRDAAYCFNWIKRNRKLAGVAPDGDVILKPEIREQIKAIHAEKSPDEANAREELSCVLNAFMDIFPNPNLHWIPVNLHLLNCFNRKLCQAVFDGPSYEEIDKFVDEYPEVFAVDGKQYKMLDEAKLITSRFVEIGGVQPKDGLVEEIKIRWEEDQRNAEAKRLTMEQERISLIAEEEQAQNQIQSLGNLKQKLLDDFRKPKNFKAKRIYTVGQSRLLIILGIITIGVSLFADSIGSYYAGAGIFLTILGFFWPNVEVRKPMAAGAANGPKLAIETQQRSLEHRIVGLKNRVSSMSGSIERLSSELEKVNSSVSVPYVSEE